MGNPASLLEIGDKIERETWNDLSQYFPSYETFWRLHIVPLRQQPGEIPIRSGLDQKLELLAMHHYTCYAALADAFEAGSKAPLDNLELVYANLQRSAENALKVVRYFRWAFQKCTDRQAKVDDGQVRRMLERTKPYRNYLHAAKMGVRSDSLGQALIPRRDRLEKYSTWTALRQAPPDDLVPFQQQFWSDFQSLCSALEECWHRMLKRSSELMSNARYADMQRAGQTLKPDITSAHVAVTSNTQEGP